MPAIRLYPQDDGGSTITGPPGAGEYLRQWRLRVWVRLGNEFQVRQAVLDTGAPACILSQQVWAPLHQRGQIEWVCNAPGLVAREQLPRLAVVRGRYPYRLGWLRLQPVDLGTGELSARPVVAICTEDGRTVPGDPESLPRLLVLGMAEVLNGRTLQLSVSADGKSWAGSLSETA